MILKRIVKFCLSCLSVLIFYNRKSKIFYLHDIHKEQCYAASDHSVPLYDFLRLLKVISDFGFQIVQEITSDKNQVAISFDDGYRGIWDCRFELIHLGIYPTIYVATSLIGKENYLSESEIIELEALGFSIQSHTVSHKALTGLSLEQLQAELSDSQRRLSDILNKKIDDICLPLGLYNQQVIVEASKIYKRVFISVPGPYNLSSTQVNYRYLCQSMSPTAMKFALIGGYDIYKAHINKLHYRHV